MPISMWAFLEKQAALTTGGNLSKMLQLLAEKEQLQPSTRYVWSGYGVHLVEEPEALLHGQIIEQMKREGITPPPAVASSDQTAPSKPAPTPPGEKPAGDR